MKRSGLREPFDRAKVVEGVRAACKNRPVSAEQMEALAQGVEDALRAETTEPTSQQVGVAVLERLQASTTWPISASPASTRVSRRRVTSSARRGC